MKTSPGRWPRWLGGISLLAVWFRSPFEIDWVATEVERACAESETDDPDGLTWRTSAVEELTKP